MVEGAGVEGNFRRRRRFGAGKEFGRWKWVWDGRELGGGEPQ